MPVLECCSPFKTLLLSTLLSAVAIRKLISFPLSPSQNIQTAIFPQNKIPQPKNIKAQTCEQKQGREIGFWLGILQPQIVPDEVPNVCLSVRVSLHHAHAGQNPARPLVFSPPLVGLNHLLRYALVGCLSRESSTKRTADTEFVRAFDGGRKHMQPALLYPIKTPCRRGSRSPIALRLTLSLLPPMRKTGPDYTRSTP